MATPKVAILFSNCPGNIYSLSSYGNNLYSASTNANSILQTDLTGTTISWLSLSSPTSCFAYKDYLYVLNASGIYKVKINGDGSPGTPNLIISSGSITSFTIGKINNIEYFFLGELEPIYIVPLNNYTVPKILFYANTVVSSVMITIGDYLYVASGQNNTLLQLTLTFTPTSIVWATTAQGILGPTGMAYFNGYLYISNYTSHNIIRISTSEPTDYDSNYMVAVNQYAYLFGLTSRLNYLYIGGDSQQIFKGKLPPLPCFKEGTKILTDQGYKLVEDLRKGDLVKTLRNDYLPVVMIGKREMHHDALEERIKDQLYQYSQSEYPEIFEPLVITGCHSILLDLLTEEQREKTTEVLGKIYVTDKKYRLPACVDEKASVYEIPGDYTIYHIALENEHYTGNYGIYANGLLVETCSKRYLKEFSEMEILE